MQDQVIVVEQLLDAPVSKVWKAISDKTEMKKWYFDMSDFKTEVGFEFHFSGGTPEKTYLHLCRIKEVIPYAKLSYSWRYDGYEGDSLVTFELTEKGNQTFIKLSHSGIETFPKIPDLVRGNFVEGWNAIIKQMLPEHLAKS